MTEKKDVHYREFFKTIYLSSTDIVEPTTYTIARVAGEKDKSKRTQETFVTAHFVEKFIRPEEKMPPMILNPGNCKILTGITGTPHINKWVNVPVIIYTDPNVKMKGEVVGGLKISTEKPKLQKPELTPQDKVKWQRAIESYKQTKSFDAIEKAMILSDENKTLIREAGNE